MTLLLSTFSSVKSSSVLLVAQVFTHSAFVRQRVVADLALGGRRLPQEPLLAHRPAGRSCGSIRPGPSIQLRRYSWSYPLSKRHAQFLRWVLPVTTYWVFNVQNGRLCPGTSGVPSFRSLSGTGCGDSRFSHSGRRFYQSTQVSSVSSAPCEQPVLGSRR